MYSFLLLRCLAADVTISPLAGLSKIEEVTLEKGQKISYTANFRTVIHCEGFHYLRRTITPDTTEKGNDYVILSEGSLFEAEYYFGSNPNFSFIISRIPNNCKKIVFVDGNFVEFSISASDFNESDPSSVEPRVFINTKTGTFNFMFINPLPIRNFKIF